MIYHVSTYNLKDYFWNLISENLLSKKCLHSDGTLEKHNGTILDLTAEEMKRVLNVRTPIRVFRVNYERW